MKELQEKLMQIKSSLTPRQQKYINLRSLENFFQYFDELEDEHKWVVERIMRDYFKIIEKHNYLIDQRTCAEISFSHILKIGQYYKSDVGFKYCLKLLDVFYRGLPVDFLLLISGVLAKTFYFPVVTLCLFLRWLYLKKNYGDKHKTYGVMY
ncbi:MAG TPA: hypothetical protein VL053_08210 [Arachidicoccus sp.]|nr:hypothetical protein [Arachidicoccus sp.]